MLKKLFLLLCAGMLLSCLNLPVAAQDEDTDTEAETEQVETISIPELVSKAEFVTKVKPGKKAVVYYFLRSHARCGFCRHIVPQMNELYKEMKGKGAELIMLNGDPNTETAKKWAAESDIQIPMITPESGGSIASVVPGGGTGGSPNVMAVMADGTQIEGTSGASKCPALVGTWKDMVKEARKAERTKAAAQKKAKAKAKAKKKKKKKAAASEDL